MTALGLRADQRPMSLWATGAVRYYREIGIKIPDALVRAN